VIVNTPIDGGNGVSLAAVDIPKLGRTPSATFYLLALATAAVTLLVAWGISVSKLGAGLFAIHDDEDAAEVMGVPTYRYKLLALGISCALAGVAGGIHALFLNYVTVGEVFTITVPLTVVLMSVLGGTRHWAGPAVGAVAITLLLYAFTAANHAVAGKAMVGVILIAAILFMPDGVLPRLQRAFGRRGSVPAPAELPAARPRRPAACCCVTARGLAKSFRGVRALGGVDVEVRRGEILGLLGPNGSGKSTFINVVSGHYVPSGGSVAFEGQELAGRRRTASRAPASRAPTRSRAPSATRRCWTTWRWRRCSAAASPRRRRRGARPWPGCAFAGLQDKADGAAGRAEPAPAQVPGTGARAGVAAAAGAAGRGAVRADAGEIDDAVALVRRIRDQGATVVFVEHVMRAVMALTDRVVVFDQGLVLAEGPAAEVMQRPEVMTAYLGQPQPLHGRAPREHAACLRCSDLQVAYGAAPALWGVDLSLRAR
jgi:branched-chain amino acid transport system permease protein